MLVSCYVRRGRCIDARLDFLKTHFYLMLIDVVLEVV